MITDYQVVESGDEDELSKEVKAAIEDGWQPFGGLSVTVWFDIEWTDEPVYWYAQPMVKYVES